MNAAAHGPSLHGAPPRSVLIVITRRIGDVILSLPLVESLHRAWPGTAIDALVFRGTEGVLATHPAVRHVTTVAERPAFGAHVALVGRLLRRYDLALSLVPGDRPTLYAFLAGRRRAGLLVDCAKERWKQRLLHRWVAFDNLDTHTLRMHLALAEVLGITPSSAFDLPSSPEDVRQVDALLGTRADRPLAVLHPYPKYRYKMWPRECWIALGHWLAQDGHRLLLTGGPDTTERDYLNDLLRDLPRETVCAAGRLTLSGSAHAISRARVYIGPDTAMTHIAAALGVPTVALFGPSNPVKWGPWPKNHPADRNPWRRCGMQRVGNVLLVQSTEACVPCLLEGCDRHVDSASDCLTQLPLEKVQWAVRAVLEEQNRDVWAAESGSRTAD